MLSTLSNLLFPPIEPPEAHKASDGTFWRTEGQALLHDLIELRWERLLPTLRDADTVRETRESLRLSQSELARAADISQPGLCMFERKRYQISESVACR